MVTETVSETDIHTVDLLEENMQNDDEEADEKKIWSDDNIKLLIELCKKYDEEFQKGVKKKVWCKIALIISSRTGINVTGIQCDTKWKELLRHYKLIKKHNNTSGNESKYWRFYNSMDNILHKKTEITPVATCSSASGLKRQSEGRIIASIKKSCNYLL